MGEVFLPGFPSEKIEEFTLLMRRVNTLLEEPAPQEALAKEETPGVELGPSGGNW